MASRPRSIAQLLDASDHLAYEFEMLRFTAKELADRASEQTDMVNVLLESFAIHARNLFEFFGGGQRERYMYATHYVDDWKHPESNLLGRTGGKANEGVVHL